MPATEDDTMKVQETDLDRSDSCSHNEDSSAPEYELSYWKILMTELSSENDENVNVKFDEKTEEISNFLNVPLHIEKLMFIGYLICLDSFLYIFTILPLRIIIAIFYLAKSKFMYY